ncbi:hypothetical protein [Nocardia sp. NPDC003979]
MPLSPEALWGVLSRTDAIGQWMSAHHAWIGAVPDQLEAGSRLVAQIQLFDMIHEVDLLVAHCTSASAWTMTAATTIGFSITFQLAVHPIPQGSQIKLQTFLLSALLGDTDTTILRHAVQLGVDSSLHRLVTLADDAVASAVNSDADSV